jgi:hypothetical protein
MDGQSEPASDILVIGGGIAGLSAASALQQAGARVTVLDKGRGPGGRMAARRLELGGAQLTFDHGAQYFTARDPGFRAAVAAWQAAGVAARWPAAGEDAWVGTPGMNAPLRAMAEPLDLRWNVRAERLHRGGALWRVEAGEQVFTAATVLICLPAEQAAALLADPAPDLAALAGSVTSAPCWAAMAAFAAPLSLAADTLRPDAGAIGWAARNSAKPGRAGGVETWVIHASPARSRDLLDRPKDEVAAALLADFFAAAGIAPVIPQHLDAHRWLYALPEARKGEGSVYDADLRLGVAGDWLHSPRVEGAWLSGRALAQVVVQERVASTS